MFEPTIAFYTCYFKSITTRLVNRYKTPPRATGREHINNIGKQSKVNVNVLTQIVLHFQVSYK